MGGDETIAAIATAPGQGGIGVVRVSGVDALRVVAGLLPAGMRLEAGRARWVRLVDAEAGGAPVDEAVVTYFAAPRSYTTEDVVELACHGAPVLLGWVLGRVLAAGARLAEAGEFTRRALLGGRLDLAQAEAVEDLVRATTMAQARAAAAQLGGALAFALRPVKDRLLNLIAELEAGIDFAEDDLELMPEAAVAGRIGAVLEPLEALAGTYRAGRVLREGFTLALVGRPNAGKSSLFNRLLGVERAIVTAEPGTTRDVVSEAWQVGGVPVRLVDTAGLRAEPVGEAERAGIVRTGEAMAEADVVLVVLDGAAFVAKDLEMVRGLAGRAHVVVVNKSDLAGVVLEGALAVSALTGDGVEALRGRLLEVMGAAGEGAVVTHLRQFEALGEACAGLRAAGVASAASVPHEMVLLDLYRGLAGMDAVTGMTGSEEVLDRIFAGFCVGK